MTRAVELYLESLKQQDEQNREEKDPEQSEGEEDHEECDTDDTVADGEDQGESDCDDYFDPDSYENQDHAADEQQQDGWEIGSGLVLSLSRLSLHPFNALAEPPVMRDPSIDPQFQSFHNHVLRLKALVESRQRPLVNLLITRDFLKRFEIRDTRMRRQVVDMKNVLRIHVAIPSKKIRFDEESRTSMTEDLQRYLIPTAIIDSHDKTVREYALKVVNGLVDPVDIAVKLYLAVRDSIVYDPYTPFYLPEHYRAGHVLKQGRGFCVPKASLLCALGRACSIPSRVGFASVRNHLATRQLIELMGSDIFAYHGFVEFYLDGKWVKCTPAFNRELCRRHNVSPLEFNGREDSLFHAYSLDNRKFMEYIEYHESYADIPVELIVAAWKKAYGEDRVNSWIAAFESGKSNGLGKFNQEDVV